MREADLLLCRRFARLAALLVCTTGLCAAAAGKRADGLLVRTDGGLVRGVVRGNEREFRGIPYARAPVGSLRWRPPVTAVSWKGVRSAGHFGSACPQVTELGAFADPSSATEDCLVLNVTAPSTAGSPPLGLPVLMWIHGGGLVAGAAHDYDGSALARGGPAGPVVVVTVNYRLGLLGFLATRSLDEEGHAFGNYGFMDQQAALRWIRRNIARFGGDPNNITLGGQSSGGSGVVAAMLSRSGEPFQKAILQSGLFLPRTLLADAERTGAAFATAAGCGSDGRNSDCLRQLPLVTILALQGSRAANGPYVTGPIADGAVIPRASDLWASGALRRVPVLSGTVLDEGRFDASIDEMNFGPLTQQRYVQVVNRMFGAAGAKAQAVLAHYPAASFPNPALALAALVSDSHVCPIPPIYDALSSSATLYAYEFADRTAPWYFPAQSFPSGAAHTADLQYVFPLWHGGARGTGHALDAAQKSLSEEIIAGWTAFMYRADPNGPGMTTWPRYLPERPRYALQRAEGFKTISEADFVAEHGCSFWRALAEPGKS